MLTPIKLKAIELAASGVDWVEVAKKVGKSENTIHHWKQDPDFKAEYQKQRAAFLDEAIETASSDIRALVPIAIATLRDAMEKHKSIKPALAVLAGLGLLKPLPVEIKEEIIVEFGSANAPDIAEGNPIEDKNTQSDGLATPDPK